LLLLPIPEAGYGTATSLVCCRCGDLHRGRVPWLESSQCRTAHSRGSIDIPRRSRDFLEPRICEQWHLDGEEQGQNVRIEMKNHRMLATRAPGQTTQDLIVRLV